ncbi:MAG: ATP-grasp domain-containing protein [Acidobacteria bacterium]|nr:ATP-grasp domain-containing protein [Acidobacteriota bacterium]MCW5967282.1 ATP-grasp domain-containing protein [Blastocatellales bacterium]
MKLFFMVVRRVPPVPSPILVETYDRLRARGYEVGESIAEEVLTRSDEVEVENDLYILKSHTELSLSLAGALFTRGARMLNPYPSCALTQNKIIVSRLLTEAGVPAPRSWVTADFTLLRELASETPLIIKPYMGHRGAGITKITKPEDLDSFTAPEFPMIVQELIPGHGEDLKIYVVGDQVHGVQKPFSETSFSVPGRPVPISDEVRDLARRVGRICGLGLYGLDVIESPRGPFVVDVNYFPGYKGVPGAAEMIADYIDDYAQGRITLASPGAIASGAAAD